eukprot:TRINITY_DN10291_c0_g1_i1.p1 TRINITY_DN10291_c0_g1~~TRINITY_DN10291_c0_g1_i1.p1  ORF type:complete len:238 (-),score=83.63 TRINITY_DN10291_c0_g1_i1:126-839(-)
MSTEVTKKADQLYKDKSLDQVHSLLEDAEKSHAEDPEVLWRLSRSYYDVSESKPDDKDFRLDHLQKGAKVAEKALEKAPESWQSHKWWAFNISALGTLQSTQEKIANALKIKEHADKTLSINPKDADTEYLLGRWHFSVAGVGWLERKVAGALFGAVPESTYDNALTHFLKCAELDPKGEEFSHLRNTSFLGDTYEQLSQPQNAQASYEKASKIAPRTEFDKNYLKEVNQKLEKYSW